MPDPKLSERQWELLLWFLKEHPSDEVAYRKVPGAGTFSRTIDSLDRKGLLDASFFSVCLTPAGRALAEKRKRGEV